MRPDPVRDTGLRELGANERLRSIAFDEFGRRRPHPERVQLLEDYKIEIKATYRRMSRELHPDMNIGIPAAERKDREDRFKAISAAYEFLSTLSVRDEPAPRGRFHHPQGMRICVVVPNMEPMIELERLRRVLYQDMGIFWGPTGP